MLVTPEQVWDAGERAALMLGDDHPAINMQGTPMTYYSGETDRQYLIVTVRNPSWSFPRDRETGTYVDTRTPRDGQGGYVIAYALE